MDPLQAIVEDLHWRVPLPIIITLQPVSQFVAQFWNNLKNRCHNDQNVGSFSVFDCDPVPLGTLLNILVCSFIYLYLYIHKNGYPKNRCTTVQGLHVHRCMNHGLPAGGPDHIGGERCPTGCFFSLVDEAASWIYEAAGLAKILSSYKIADFSL